MRRPPLLVVAAVFVPLACTLPTAQKDAGATDAGSQIVGDQCMAIFKELCQQGAGRCGIGLSFTLDQCISANMPTCCTGTGCNATSLSSRSEVIACEQAIDVEDCYSMANSVTPGPCVGVPRLP
jgi:hypothetical protein